MKKDMKYTRLSEQYSIDENDGSGPFPREADSILIFYNEKNGNPIRARMTMATPIDEAINVSHFGPRMRVEKDPSKLAKIVEFFHSK